MGAGYVISAMYSFASDKYGKGAVEQKFFVMISQSEQTKKPFHHHEQQDEKKQTKEKIFYLAVSYSLPTFRVRSDHRNLPCFM